MNIDDQEVPYTKRIDYFFAKPESAIHKSGTILIETCKQLLYIKTRLAQ